MANYRGTENVEFISRGSQSDPLLRYDGKLFNYWDIENALWDMFEEEYPMDAYEENMYAFNKYVQERCVDYLDDCIFGGYFAD